jgi:hypothetical protein
MEKSRRKFILCSADPKNKQARKSMPNKTEDLEIDDDDE